MQIVKDFLIKFTKKSHLRHLLTEQSLDFVLHGLFRCFAEMDTYNIGGLVDGLAVARLCVLAVVWIVFVFIEYLLEMRKARQGKV